MVETIPGRSAPGAFSSFPELYVQAFRWMLLSRVLDEKLAGLYRAGKIPGGGVYLGKGQEALSAAIGVCLTKGDVFAPLIRDGAGRLAFGESVLDAARNCVGSALGPMRGRDGNVHRGRPREGYLPMISHLGAMLSVVNGCLIGKRYNRISNAVGVSSIGEGGTSTGAFHEGLNQAAVEKLPHVIVVADNQFAYSTPKSRQFACKSLVDRAHGYGVTGHEVDGTDLGSCLKVLHHAVENARHGGGPHLVVAQLLRLCGHGEHDDACYINNELKDSPLGRDCLLIAERELLKQGWASQGQALSWREEAHQLVEDSVSAAQREAGPDPYKETWSALASRHFSEGFEDLQEA